MRCKAEEVAIPQPKFVSLLGVPKPVLFWDMSLASTSWAWAFGDGGGTGVRSPQYTYNTAGYYTVTQFVNGAGGSHQASKPILIGISNRIDDPEEFVRQQYLDFLNREPDPGGLAFWASQITNCGTNQTCIHNELKLSETVPIGAHRSAA